VNSARLKMVFTYSGSSERTDYQIDGWSDGDCRQAMFSKYFLEQIGVNVWDVAAGGWHRLSDTVLNTGLATAYYPSAAKRHLLLNSVVTYGDLGTSVAASLQVTTEIVSFSYNYWPAYGSDTGHTVNGVRLSRAASSLGGAMNYSYLQTSVGHISSNYCNVSCYRWPVSRRVAEDGLGHYDHTAIIYTGGKLYIEPDPLDPNKKRYITFLGFANVATTVLDRSTSSSTGGAALRRDEYNFHNVTGANTPEPRAGKLITQTTFRHTNSGACSGWQIASTWDATWCRMAQASTQWSAWTLSGAVETAATPGTTQPVWVRQESQTTVTDGTATSVATFYEPVRQGGGQYGNVTLVKEFDGALTGTLLRQTYTDFAPNVGANLVSLPGRVRIFTGSSSCVNEQRLVYDSAPTATTGSFTTPPVKGLATMSMQALAACTDTNPIPLGDGGWSVRTSEYDAVGNATKLTLVDAVGITDTVIHTLYDTDFRLFPVKQYYGDEAAYLETAAYYGVTQINSGVASPPGLGDAKAYWGRMAEQCAVNGICTRQAYDDQGRLVKRWSRVNPVNVPWSSTEAHPVKTTWVYLTPSMTGGTTFVAAELSEPSANGGDRVRRHYNGLGQLVLEQRTQPGWNSTLWPEVEILHEYDGLGREVAVSMPLPVLNKGGAKAWYTLPTPAADAFATTSYDALGRPLVQTRLSGEKILYAYSGRASSVVQDSSAGADGGKRLLSRQELDALGALKSVRNYDWAGNNSWTQVAEVLLLHDVEGQLLVVTPSIGITLTTVITYDLAGRKTGMRDPDLGVWGYTYTKQGALLTQSDARNCLTTLAYDLKGRVVSKVGSGCTAATGTDTTGYTVNFGYFAMGSALGSSGQLASAGYSDNRFRRSLTYGGDGLLNGQTVTVTGLSPVTLAFGYDGYDRPTTTSYPALGGQPAEVVTTAYADTGQPMTLTSSLAGVIGVLRYDAYRRPVTLTYSAGGVAQVWGYYAFNSNGTAAGHGNTEGRLASLKVGTGALNQPNFTYSYDRFGNLETITDSGAPNTFVYDLQNRLTTAYGESYSYDGIGRLTNYEGTPLIAFGAYGRRTTSAVYTDDCVCQSKIASKDDEKARQLDKLRERKIMRNRVKR
jgi:hypothetical protein